MSPGFAEEMAEHDEMFEQAEAASGPPIFTDGQHQVIITVSRVEQSDFGWQWVLGFRGIDSATKKPASIRKWTNLPPENEERAGYLKADLAKLGYEGYLSGLEQACIDEQFIGVVVDIGVKTKPGQERDYTNVFLNRSYEKVDVDEWLKSRGGDSGSGAPASAEADFVPIPDEDDIPF